MIEAASEGRAATGRPGETPAVWGLAITHVVERAQDVERARAAILPMAIANARFALSTTFAGKHVPEELQPLLRERLRRYDHGTHGRETGANPNAALFADLPEVEDYVLRRFSIVGTPDECRRRVEELLAGGLDGLWLTMVVPDPIEHLELAADTFRPLLRR
jgi:alkanesulfonate monooxygenase SsuD/methylene tetrahydromethanopterin reductase-like flavin-dependent oxidoreductase (luciferase family)